MTSDSDPQPEPDPSASSELILARIQRVLPFRDSAAVVLEAEGKRFMIFVGVYEAAALMREINEERTERPLTHDVISYVMTGFDIMVQKVVISSIVNRVFCATLVLVRSVGGEREEVHLDIRASDSLVIAQKAQSPIWVTRGVLSEVEDVTDTLIQIDSQFSSTIDDDEDPDEDPEDDDILESDFGD